MSHLIVNRRQTLLAVPALFAATRALAQPSGRYGREVLAFYYTWYGTPTVSGQWHHWERVDPVQKIIGNTRHYPAEGAYDSHDPRVIERQLRQMKSAGITGLIYSWWGQGKFEDQAVFPVLDAAARHGLKVTCYLEQEAASTEPERAAGAASDIAYLLQRYSGHPAWLRVQGKPALFLYGDSVHRINPQDWTAILGGSAGAPRPAVFADADTTSALGRRLFNAEHIYNIATGTAGLSGSALRQWARQTYGAWVEASAGQLACVTVMPGHDSSKVRPPPVLITDRLGGDTYRILWEEAIAARPDWVLINSWNEWHEGSEIEPSAEDGDAALNTTRTYAQAFRRI